MKKKPGKSKYLAGQGLHGTNPQARKQERVTQKFTGHGFNRLTQDFENSTEKLHSKMVVKQLSSAGRAEKGWII